MTQQKCPENQFTQRRFIAHHVAQSRQGDLQKLARLGDDRRDRRRLMRKNGGVADETIRRVHRQDSFVDTFDAVINRDLAFEYDVEVLMLVTWLEQNLAPLHDAL